MLKVMFIENGDVGKVVKSSSIFEEEVVNIVHNASPRHVLINNIRIT
jgi:hypothetical protein